MAALEGDNVGSAQPMDALEDTFWLPRWLNLWLLSKDTCWSLGWPLGCSRITTFGPLAGASYGSSWSAHFELASGRSRGTHFGLLGATYGRAQVGDTCWGVWPAHSMATQNLWTLFRCMFLELRVCHEGIAPGGTMTPQHGPLPLYSALLPWISQLGRLEVVRY